MSEPGRDLRSAITKLKRQEHLSIPNAMWNQALDAVMGVLTTDDDDLTIARATIASLGQTIADQHAEIERLQAEIRGYFDAAHTRTEPETKK